MFFREKNKKDKPKKCANILGRTNGKGEKDKHDDGKWEKINNKKEKTNGETTLVGLKAAYLLNVL